MMGMFIGPQCHVERQAHEEALAYLSRLCYCNVGSNGRRLRLDTKYVWNSPRRVEFDVVPLRSLVEHPRHMSLQVRQMKKDYMLICLR